MSERPTVLIETKMGDIMIELYADEAPISVETFLRYVESDFYKGTIFHRVIPDFMIQGGGFTWNMKEKPPWDPIQNEAANGLKNTRGTVAMARTAEIHSASAQFFVNLVDNPDLDHSGEAPEDYGYAVFGQVVDGMEVVDEIGKVPTRRVGEMEDVPVKPVTIVDAAVM
jgi:peptidyl-prolyl cis-trans isomerase B (cyclophilin B)